MAGDQKTIGWGEDKVGRTIRVDWETDTERPNRGFVCHKATAWHEDEFQGYLRVSYVDPVVYERHNPTIWNHFHNFSGMCLAIYDEDPRGLRGEAASSFFKTALHYLGRYNTPVPDTWEDFEQEAQATRRYPSLVKQREDFFEFHLNKPYVDYADVSGGSGRILRDGTPDRRGMGVGKLLYFGTAHALSDMGLGFHSSGIQTEEAQGIWARFSEMGLISSQPVSKDKNRFLLHAERIPENLFTREAAGPQEPSF